MSDQRSYAYSGSVPRNARNEWQKWGLSLAVVASMLLAPYALIYYAGQKHLEKVLEAQMPTAYRSSLRTLIAAGGNTCLEVCNATPLASTPPGASLNVSCGVSPAATCTQTRDYRVTVEAAEQSAK